MKTQLKNMSTGILAVILSLAMINCSEDDVTPPPVDEKILYNDINFNSAVMTESGKYGTPSSSTFQFFESTENTDTARPMIILAPGGGYTEYSQESALRSMAIDLANRGYAVAMIRYTVNAPDGPTFVRSVIDMKTAVRYFKTNAEAYNIDPDKIFTGGWSTGAQLSLYAAHFDQEDLDALTQEPLHTMIQDAVDIYGIDGDEHLAATSEVKGMLLMMPYICDVNVLDEDGPAMMMISHPRQQFLDGTILMGAFHFNGVWNYGPDLMRARLLSIGYTEEKDLAYIMMPNSFGGDYPNQSLLTSDNYDSIAAFFFRQLGED